MPIKKSSGVQPCGGKKPSKRIAANGFRLPDPIAPGQILTDMTQKQWRIGKSIGVGGFGEIYLASDDIATPTDGTNADYCVKVEPHNNGPLFTEMHCYMRVAKPDDINAWKEEHNKPRLGMPRYMGSGSHTYDDSKYRFMVMERFGSDLQKIFEKNNKKFSLKTTYQLGIQIIDVLEYVHSKEYIHADIKASNLLLGHRPGTEDQVFLVDYGLGCRFAKDGKHKEYRYDARKAHDGTMEFTSRDAHIGAHSRRGDLEILGYNLVQWLCRQLPWEDSLTDCDYVATMKRGYMEDIPLFMYKCFGNDIPPGLEQYLEYVKSLSFDEQPDYNKCRKILQKALATHGYVDDGHLDFSDSQKPEKKIRSRTDKKTRKGCKRVEGEENIPELAPKKVVRRSSQMSPCRPRNRVMTRTSSQNEDTNRVMTRTLSQNENTPNRIMTRTLSQNENTPNRVMTRTLSQYEDTPVMESSLSKIGITTPFPNLEDEDEMIIKEQQRIELRKLSQPLSIEITRDTSLDNPTPQMIELLNKIREKSSSPPVCQKRHRHNSTCKGNGSMNASLFDRSTPFTPEMEAVMRRRVERNTYEDLSCSESEASSSPVDLSCSVSEASSSPVDLSCFESEASCSAVDLSYSESEAPCSPVDLSYSESPYSPMDLSCSDSNASSSPPIFDSESEASSSSPMFDSESEYSNDSVDINVYNSRINQSPPAIRAIIRQSPPHIRTFFASVPSATYMNEPPELRNFATPSPTGDMYAPVDSDKLHPLSNYQDGMYSYPSPPQETEYETLYPTIPENEAMSNSTKKMSSLKNNKNLSRTGVRSTVGQRELAQIISTAECLEVRHMSPRKNPRLRVTRSIYRQASRELLSH